MIAYQIYVQDDRYSVPTLWFIEAPHDQQAIGIARRKLETSPHHIAVEVRRGDLYVAGFGSADPEKPSYPLYGRMAG